MVREMDLYVCKFSSWYHLLGVLAYFKRLKTKPRCIAFLATPFKGVSARTNERVMSECAEEVFFLKSVDELNSLLLDARWERKRVGLVTPTKRPYRVYKLISSKAASVKLILTEEGLGSYGGYRQDVKAYLREDLARVKWPLPIKYALALAVIFLLNSYFKFRVNERCFIFDSSLRLDQRMSSSYLDVLDTLSPMDFSLPGAGKYILVVTPPVVELGLISEEQLLAELDVLRVSLTGLADLLIKPHPIENVTKYRKFAVLPADTPAEWILMRCSEQIVQVVTPSSTFAYVSKFLFGRETRRFPGFDPLYETLTDRQQRLVASGRAW